MAVGQGSYDDVCTYVRETTKAVGAIVIVFNGEFGSGFSVQAPLELTVNLAAVLRHMADDIESSGIPHIKDWGASPQG
jgi:hypothetical protein